MIFWLLWLLLLRRLLRPLLLSEAASRTCKGGGKKW